MAVPRQIEVREAPKIGKAFVYAVNLYVAGKLAQHLHHPAAEVAIQGVIAAEYMDVMPAELIFDLEIGHPQVEAKRLSFIALGNHHAVIV